MLRLLASGWSATTGCPPIALLHGEADLVLAVRANLDHRGIRTEPVAGCDWLRVDLDARGARLDLEIVSERGTKIGRAARNPLEAATIIESWVRTDVTAPLLDHDLPPEVRQPLRVAESELAVPPLETEAPPLEPRSFMLSAGAVGVMADDASAWSGVDVRGCILVAPVCLGGRFQYAVDLRTGGDAERLNGDRELLEVGATVDYPIVVDEFELAPGLGISWAKTLTEREIDPAAQLDIEASAQTVRLRAQLGASWRFADHWALRLDAALDGAPFAKRAIVQNGQELPEQPSLMGGLRFGFEAGGF